MGYIFMTPHRRRGGEGLCAVSLNLSFIGIDSDKNVVSLRAARFMVGFTARERDFLLPKTSRLTRENPKYSGLTLKKLQTSPQIACENCPRPPSYVQLGTLTY
jgi:hypothetical protein